MNHRKILLKTKNHEDTTNFLMTERYIIDRQCCADWGNTEMKVIKNGKVKSCQCIKCKIYIFSLENTKLHGYKKPLNEIIDIIYFRSIDLIRSRCLFESKILLKKTCIVWYKQLGLQAYHTMKSIKIDKIFNIGDIVGDKESKFSKWKYIIRRGLDRYG